MNLNATLGLIATIALSLPILFLVIFRLGVYRSFPALLSYFLLVFAYNLFQKGYLHGSSELVGNWNILNNFVDAPLMLVFLTYFSTSPALTKKMRLTIAGILIFEIAVICIAGFNNKAVTIFLGPALAVVFAFSLHFFVRQTKIAISHRKAIGKAIISAALLFAYGCYLIIYLMYYVMQTQFVEDTFLVYYLVITVSSILLSVGIVAEKKRVQKLSELLQTRKELSAIYSNQPQIPSLRKVALDFDKDPWL